MVKQKIVMKVTMEDSRKRSKALRSAVGSPGVISASVDGDKIVVEGDGIDPVALTATLRKRMGYVELVSVAAKDEKKEEKETKPVVWPYHIQVAPPYTAYGYHQPNYEPSCNTM
ncbi:heavy metal-associated isoprenylated plant protein 16-like [Phoenix dactylifera]|uniref:Heavy metal-associated isoprenylated plant protein 16-like n=1 Tax=Phoenix dactylifera TaxID=42345 RepID=A0A8B8ZW62_PHODC|nr:heavy metal-associated isoprenylated plant protein 16-like isoform X2 [Phoenix dactylifera]XP_017699163.1 heavy metal-associated isoprenylated plant protein 16-like isoform X3 [Phoenix dactylifera]XP_038978526.1 heavy metal-associated isoprenylated plant protein 16-like [Phoenix dactylifera]